MHVPYEGLAEVSSKCHVWLKRQAKCKLARGLGLKSRHGLITIDVFFNSSFIHKIHLGGQLCVAD
jgi:hypothetical protein